MALNKVRVQRNLHARIRWFVFEVEDLVLLSVLWVATELACSLFERTIFGMPAEVVLPWMVVLLAWGGLRVFKYGKPPAYLIDLIDFHRLPHIYCSSEPDPHPGRPYLRPEVE
jgi:hypothetical protein